MRRAAIFLLGSVLLAGWPGVPNAETLPLPPNLVAFDSDEGEALLVSADERDDFFALSSHFVTQINPAFCGPASIAMVLNALGVPRPPSDMTLGLGMFDQVNVFTEQTEAVKPQASIMRGGMTLDQVGGVLATYGVTADVHHAGDSNVDEFRDLATVALGDAESDFVLVNYLRKALGQESGGHISPLAAYDIETDRFLILDVSRYKYPPVWVTTADLFAAMNTPDSDANDLTRGYVIVSQ